jgi:hypothetical protein
MPPAAFEQPAESAGGDPEARGATGQDAADRDDEPDAQQPG